MRSIALLLLVVMFGCSSLPTLPQADRSRSPHQVSREGLGNSEQKRQWGGILIGIRADELEILAYPLDTDGRPRTEEKSAGRFLARITDQVEPGDLSIGQHITATGPILSIQSGRVGQADYLFPVMACEDLAVWPEPGRARTRPRIHFGFGASSGGGGHGSIGIGIGF